jgi:hypothetical protein
MQDYNSRYGGAALDAQLDKVDVVDVKITKLESIIGVDFFTFKNKAVRLDGSVTDTSSGIDSTDFLPITGRTAVGIVNGWTNISSNIAPLAFYDENKQFISYTGETTGWTNLVIPAEEIPNKAKYIRCTGYPEGKTPIIYGCTIGSVWHEVVNNFSVVGAVPNGTNLNEFVKNGTYLLSSDYSYINAPSTVGFLQVFHPSGNAVLQVFYNYAGTKCWKRTRRVDLTWESWQLISALENVPTIEATLPSGDLNEVGKNATFILGEEKNYTNGPYQKPIGFLRVSTTGNFTLQEFFPFTENKLYKRRGQIGGNWTAWGEISGNGVVNNITYPTYNNTYEIQVTPSISVADDFYLAPKDDGSDRTAEIVAMLQTTGVCRLGKGYYNVKDLVMPNNSMIIGSGASTKILLANDGKFAIKMNSQCSVKDLFLVGNTSEIAVSDTLAERHGILWQGDFAQSENYANQPKFGHIENVWIRSFKGGGITCYNTGYGTTSMLEVANASIFNCGAGINVSYFSEFHKFTNVRCSGCYYGCINNGGNNVFVNCDFSSSVGIAFLMDNSQGQSTNNSHGSAVGCVFNHTANNAGIGIKILANRNGFIFDGCQLFFSQIYIESSEGILFGNCNFGQSNCDITIKGNGAILFANNIFQGKPAISISNNSATKFVNCIIRSTGTEIVA